MRPLVIVELSPEFCHLLRVRHVDERIALVSLTFFVNRHLKKVIASKKTFVNLVQEYVLCQSVGDIFNH